MDFYSMKRRELQALCKEHNIPANSANSVMADKLSELLNEKQKPRAQRTCMKSSDETIDESEPVVSRRQAKKVRFSPDVDLVGSEQRYGKKQEAIVTDMKVRKSVASKVDNDDDFELIDDGVQIPVKLTRSRVQMLGKDGVVPCKEKKQGRRAVKNIEKGTDAVKGIEGNLGKVTRSKVHTLGKGGGSQLDKNKRSKGAVKSVEKASESVEENVVGRARVTRSKAQILVEDGMGPDLNPPVKKRRGRQMAKDAENVEPPKESMDIPVRGTRARAHTLKDDSGNKVAEKKRTRKDTRSADLSNKSSNVTPDDNRELAKRKLLRTGGVDVADESEKLGHVRRKKRSEETIVEGPESQDQTDKGLRQSRKNKSKVGVSTVLNLNISKVELVNDRKLTRSRAPATRKSSGGNDKSEVDNKVEEPLEHAGRKNITRRKSDMQPEKTEVVLHLEEPAKRLSRKDSRQKSVLQKSQGKDIDKPLGGKREMEKENEMAGSPNIGTGRTGGRKQSKVQCGNLFMVDEGLEDKENVAGSGKAENEVKTVSSANGIHKSRKRRGDPIIEDHVNETEYVSPVESPSRSTRSASNSEAKCVTHQCQKSVGKKQESSFKASASRIDNSSKKRAKLSGAKQSDSEDRAENFNTKGTPVSKLANFELDEEAIKTEHTPKVDESVGRFTRSAIKSKRNAVGSSLGNVDRKKPSQSAIKEQLIGDAQLLSSKVTKLRRGPVLNTAPGRFTRSGMKLAGNAGPGESELSKGTKGQTLEHSSELSDSGSERLPIKVVEKNSISASETDIVMENVNSVSGEIASGVESYATEGALGKEVPEVVLAHIEESSIQSTHNLTKYESRTTPYLTEKLLSGKLRSPVTLPNFEDEIPSGTFLSDIKRTPFSTAEVAQTMIDDLSDGSRLQNQNQHVEAEVQVAVDSEKSILKSVRPEVHEKGIELTKSGSSSMGLQDVIVDEPVVLASKNDVMEITNDVDACYAGSSAVCHASFEQSDIKRKLEEMEAPLEPFILEGVKQFIADDGAEQDADNGEHDDEENTASVAVGIDAHEMDSVVREYDVEPNRDDALQQSTDDDKLQDLLMDEKEIKDDVVTARDRCDVADEINVHEMDSVVGQYDVAFNRDDEQSTGDDKLQGLAMDEKEIKDDVVTARDRCDVADEINGHEMDSLVGQYDVDPNRDDALEQSTGEDKLQDLAMDENKIKDDLATALDRCDVSDDDVDAGKELGKEVDFEVVPSTGNDVKEIFISGKTDSANDNKEGEIDSMPLTAPNMFDDSVLSGDDGKDQGVSANKEHGSSPMPSTGKDVFDSSFLGNVEAFNMARQVESEVLETPLSGIGIGGECDDAINDCKSYLIPSTDNDVSGTCVMDKDDVEVDGINMHKDNVEGDGVNSFEAPVSGNGADIECVVNEENDEKDGESELKQLTINDGPVVDGQDIGADAPEPLQSENIVAVPEVLITSSDQEHEPMSNAVVDVCASVERSDSLTNKETPQTPPTSGNDVTIVRFDVLESKLDINKDEVSDDLRDNDLLGNAIGATDIENDGGNQPKITGTSELDEGVLSLESEGVSVDMRNERMAEESEPTAENEHDLLDKKEQIIATVDHGLDGDKFFEDHSKYDLDESGSQLVGHIRADENPTGEKGSPIVFKNEENQLMGDVGGHGSLITQENLPITYNNEEPPFDDMVSDPPASVVDDGRNKQEKTQNASSSVDLGNHSFRMEESQKPVSANESDDVLGKSMKDEQVADVQTSARANSSIQESSSPEGALDSSLKMLLTTPATSQFGRGTNSRENAVSFAFHDGCNDDVDGNGTATHDYNDQWGNEPSRVSDGYATQNTSLGKDLKTETSGVSNLEDFGHKHSDDDEVDGLSNRSGKKEHNEFKDDEADQIKQHDDLLSEAPGTHHHDSSGLKDDLLDSAEFGIKEPGQLKGTEMGDDSAVDKVIGEV